MRTDFDRELFAQGVGNIVCGVLGGLPVTGVIVRSTANVEAGGTTRWSAIFHGAWLLIMVLLFPGILSLIPVSSLAAVLVYIGYKLVNPAIMRQLWEHERAQFGIYAVTVAAIVATSLLEGLLIGLGLSVLHLAWTFSHLEITTSKDAEGIIDINLTGAATFVRLPNLAAALETQPRDATVRIHLENLRYVDHACLEMISDWDKQRPGKLIMEWDDLRRRSQAPETQAA